MSTLIKKYNAVDPFNNINLTGTTTASNYEYDTIEINLRINMASTALYQRDAITLIHEYLRSERFDLELKRDLIKSRFRGQDNLLKQRR